MQSGYNAFCAERRPHPHCCTDLPYGAYSHLGTNRPKLALFPSFSHPPVSEYICMPSPCWRGLTKKSLDFGCKAVSKEQNRVEAKAEKCRNTRCISRLFGTGIDRFCLSKPVRPQMEVSLACIRAPRGTRPAFLRKISDPKRSGFFCPARKKNAAILAYSKGF